MIEHQRERIIALKLILEWRLSSSWDDRLKLMLIYLESTNVKETVLQIFKEICWCMLLTSSSSGTLDSLRAVEKTRGVNVTLMLAASLGAGRSACFFLLVTSLVAVWSKWRNMIINIPKPTNIDAYLITQWINYPVWPLHYLNIHCLACLSWLSLCFDHLSDSHDRVGLPPSVSVAMLLVLMLFSLAQSPSFSGYCLFPPFQAVIK